MMSSLKTARFRAPLEGRALELFEIHRTDIYKRMDRLFAVLLLVQWIAGVGVALWISPLTWIGQTSRIHPHVWTAVSLGALITFFPVALCAAWSGAAFTRHTIAVAQMLWSALLIHLTGGRIETHFHVFGSLAFLAFYRDWRVLLTATIVVASDHIVRGYYWPLSVYGVDVRSDWRWVEHAGWVVFEDAILIRSCRQGVKEMREIAVRQAETESSAEKKHEVLVNSIDGIVWEATAPDLRYRFVSAQAARILGYPADRWILEPDFWKEHLVAEDRDRVLRELGAHLQRDEVYEMEYRLRDAQGRPVWVRDAASVHRTPTGPTILRGVLTDISERKRQEEQSRRSENRFRTVVEQAADAIFVHDLDGRLLDANELACSALGYTREELLTKSLFDVERSVPREHLLKAWRTLVPGKPVTAEGNATRKDGSTFPVEVRVGLLESEGDVRVMALVRDISERRRLDRMKNEFISTVSHELRTPLTSIRGALGLVSSGVIGALPEKAKPMVDIAAKNCERLVNLVSDILDIEKIASGQMVFKIRPLILEHFLRQGVEANRGFAEAAGVALKLETGDVDATVMADGDRLLQVLTNLVSNACKYSPRGETVTVRLSRRGQRIRVTVQDRGPGISDEFRSRIFQKFAQADTSDGSQRKGTGLGLSITRALIERMG
ncbi:MAG TPA: PAS domain S-box protein [Planctomycetota bacterium]|nr:PAS domain S-box protein [Planctomycetota bacterium]